MTSPLPVSAPIESSKKFSAQGGKTHMARVEHDRVVVRGKDLCRELIGQHSFTAYFLFLLTGQSPSDALVKMTDATLIAIAEHGLVPSVVASRMTLAAAPDAFQGAVAAGLLGCGSVILGSAETAGHLLMETLELSQSSGIELKESATQKLQALKSARQTLPGFGHPIHKSGDPRAHQLLALAHEWGIAGEHVLALETLNALVPSVYGRVLPLNVSGAIPAVLLDAGFPPGALRGIPLLARTGSLVAHLLEEQTRPIGFKLAQAAEDAIEYDGALPASMTPQP
jgi:citrate synthase